MTEIRSRKNELREKYTKIRNQMPSAQRKQFDEKIIDRLLSSITYRHSQEILLYASKEEEINTRHIFDMAISAGKDVYFPKCYDGGIMHFFKIEKFEQLEKATFGLIEPVGDTKEFKNSENAALCIVPGLLFDKDGYRIGYGKGFYDRFLSRFKGVSIGLVYRKLLLDKLPRGHFDKHVDILISEKGVFAVDIGKRKKTNKTKYG